MRIFDLPDPYSYLNGVYGVIELDDSDRIIDSSESMDMITLRTLSTDKMGKRYEWRMSRAQAKSFRNTINHILDSEKKHFDFTQAA